MKSPVTLSRYAYEKNWGRKIRKALREVVYAVNSADLCTEEILKAVAKNFKINLSNLQRAYKKLKENLNRIDRHPYWQERINAHVAYLESKVEN